MLAAHALETLTRELASALTAMGLHTGEFGKPQLVEKPAKEAERIFQGYAKATPSKADAYAAARAFLRGEKLDAWHRDLVASAVAEPVREQAGAMVLGAENFPALLKEYEKEARRGDLWRLTWHGLLYSYFRFDPTDAKGQVARQGWEGLRDFLERTWPLVDGEAGTALVPDWVDVLRREPDVLGAAPTEKYASAYLRGNTAATEQLASDLGIPPSSWFWHALVLSVVRRAAAMSDAEFRQLLPRLLELVESKPGFRDEALEAILVRYHGCLGAPQDERLRDYVCQPTVWKNPKLKAAGIATAWNRVPDPVWQMVLAWVNERNLKDFFDILAARNKADEGRLDFWSKYLKQITWTRLVFGAETMALQRSKREVRDLIAREEGAYAQLTGKREVDAFMMQIGAYLIIEFSKKPNACYVYEARNLPFDRNGRHYDGGTADLAWGFNGRRAARIVHRDGWEIRAAEELEAIGIRPDRAEPHRVQGPAPRSTVGTSVRANTRASHSTPDGPDISVIQALVGRFRGASVVDKRHNLSGGRLWVEDPLQRVQLASELETLGFKWAERRQAWYFPEA